MEDSVITFALYYREIINFMEKFLLLFKNMKEYFGMIIKFTLDLLFSTMDMVILYKSTLVNILTYQKDHILPLRCVTFKPLN